MSFVIPTSGFVNKPLMLSVDFAERDLLLDYRDAIEIERRLDWIAGNLDGPAKSKILNYLHEIAALLGFDPPRVKKAKNQ